jgi:hypothetical protein
MITVAGKRWECNASSSVAATFLVTWLAVGVALGQLNSEELTVVSQASTALGEVAIMASTGKLELGVAENGKRLVLFHQKTKLVLDSFSDPLIEFPFETAAICTDNEYAVASRKLMSGSAQALVFDISGGLLVPKVSHDVGSYGEGIQAERFGIDNDRHLLVVDSGTSLLAGSLFARAEMKQAYVEDAKGVVWASGPRNSYSAAVGGNAGLRRGWAQVHLRSKRWMQLLPLTILKNGGSDEIAKLWMKAQSGSGNSLTVDLWTLEMRESEWEGNLISRTGERFSEGYVTRSFKFGDVFQLETSFAFGPRGGLNSDGVAIAKFRSQSVQCLAIRSPTVAGEIDWQDEDARRVADNQGWQIASTIYVKGREMPAFNYVRELLAYKDSERLVVLNSEANILVSAYWLGGFEFISLSPCLSLAAGVPEIGDNLTEGVQLYDLLSKKVAGSLFVVDDAMAIVTPDGMYMAKGKTSSVLGMRKLTNAFPFEQFDLRLNRPDIVLERLGAPAEAVAIAKQLRDKRLKRMGVTEEMLKPDFHVPELEIVGDVPSTTDADQINVTIKASDSKYPLERLRVYVNNVPVNGRDGESLRGQNTQTLERTIPVKLATGRNKIQVSVLNSAGAESLYANAEVNCTVQRPKPRLYAVALGVSDYANPEWNLQYAAKDARDVLERLKSKSSGSYGEVKELLLTDKQVIKESLAQIKDFLKDATIDDTVLMFVAGHGLLDSNYDYYFGTTDIDFNNPAEKGIAFEEFDDLLAGLPSLKKSLLIDTCHAGELDEEEKTLLASAGGVAAPLPTGSGIAIRSIGTRGMNVKAVEGARGASEWYDRLQGLFVDLRRGSGSTILSSSAGAEYALESSEQQNGLFTYAVLEALDGNKDADINKDGSVQMSELGEYVKKRVSELTNNKQTPNTRRVNLEGDFTVAETK